MTFISYAQNFEDVLLWRAFRDVSNGQYIDLGAAHPDVDSVTRAFYDRGWRGINVEPVPEYHHRLRAARPRDVNLQLAVGAGEGRAELHVVAGTGLSTVDATQARRYEDTWDVRGQDVEVATLAAICDRHVTGPIHFLKIDIEGAEADAIRGGDFDRYRPWIVLVEATAPNSTVPTHAGWEPMLLAAGYEFLWFDGLNRFYAAKERHAAISPHFQVPPGVFDDFLRVSDAEWARRLAQLELQAAELFERRMFAEAAGAAAEERARRAEGRALQAEQWAAQIEDRALGREHHLRALHAASEARSSNFEWRLANEVARREAEIGAVRASTSWRVTAPLRLGMRALRARGPAMPEPPASGEPESEVNPPPSEPAATPIHIPTMPAPAHHAGAGLGAVHQFHAGSALGDAITQSMLLIRERLRAMGYRSEIYVEHRDEALRDELRLLAEIPRHDEYVLILHHSMGSDAFDAVAALPAPKLLIYHNITPPELFEGFPEIQDYARLGRRQLAALAGHVPALADSPLNAIELRRLGFAQPRVCTLLFDLDRLLARAPARKRDDAFTILFVGRVVPSKGQLDLIEAFEILRRSCDRPMRLVLVGRIDTNDYTWAIRSRINALGISDQITMTGLVDDRELSAWYARADLYVSLSRHEGFGVPLVEAAAAGLPVLAWPAAAVGYTLSGLGLLPSREPHAVADHIAALLHTPDALPALAREQRAALERYRLSAQLPVLVETLARLGATTPLQRQDRETLARNMRFTVTGHVEGSYSLAAINRTLAQVLDEARPGAVRLLAAGSGAAIDLEAVPDRQRAQVGALTERPPHETEPNVVISQNYPVHVPTNRGDALLCYLFWEESLLPPATVGTLNASFDAMLAPSRFVAKTLLDSGVAVPVHVVGFAPDLDHGIVPPHARSPDRRTPFTFLHVSSAFPRKGVDVLLAAYARAFSADDDVVLVIKSFPNPHNDVAVQLSALRAANPRLPAVELIDRDIDDGDMAALLARADAMVLPTRGEGFNLPAAEAMAAGVPLIVTGYGGHMDYCDPTVARLLAFTLAPSASHLATPGSLWVEPDMDDLVGAMREAVAEPSAGLARARAAMTAVRVALDRAQFVRRVETAAVDAVLRRPAAPQRLCVVSSWGVRCGVAEYTRHLLDGMRACDPLLRITVLGDERTQPESNEEGAHRALAAWSPHADDAVQSLRAAVGREDPDAVLVQHQPSLMSWATLGRALTALAEPHRVIVVTLHNTAHLPEIDAEQRAVALDGLRRASRVIVHGLPDLERMRALGFESSAVLLPQGVPALLDGAAADAPHRRDDGPLIGCCGFLLPDKGISELIEAAALMRPRWSGIRLRLVTADYGTDLSRDAAAAAHAVAARLGVEDAIAWETEYQPFDTARRRLAACDVVVLPYQSSKESSSAAVRMAISAGPPVAVTPIALFDEARGATFRLPGLSPAAMAEGLTELLTRPDLIERMRSDARTWLRDRQWDAVAKRTLGMVKGLGASRPEA